MKIFTLLLMLVSASVPVLAQDKGFEEGMKTGFDIFNEGEDHEAWVEGAESLVELADDHPEEWLPYYWASYMYTQIARASKQNPPKGVSSEKMLDNAQKYLDLASKRIEDKTPEQEVDIHMLQRLTYTFREDDNKFNPLAEREFKEAIRKDPNHPLLLVGLGLNLLFRGDYQSVYAARVLLLKAKEKFDSRMKPRYMSTHFVEQWVNYWEPQSKKKILELTQD